MKTPDLIDVLSGTLRPTGRLPSPVVRAACWLSLAALVFALLAWSQGVRPDLAARLTEPAFIIALGASAVAGILAAIAAFMVSLPDRSPLWFFLPLPALAVWMSLVGDQCLTNWMAIGPAGVRLGDAASCFATLFLTSLPLSLAMLLMLRRATLRPMLTSVTGSLAVAAISATALSLFHDLEASALILMWNLGTVVVIVGLGSVMGRRLFSIANPTGR